VEPIGATAAISRRCLFPEQVAGCAAPNEGLRKERRAMSTAVSALTKESEQT